jgi:predicted RNA-binding Zn-ribbon protein involved in translation (DUF1610 family)
MKKDKILEAYEEILAEQYTVAGSSIGRSGSKGQRASNVALTCPQCGDLDHSHEGLEKGAKCPVCGEIVEAKLDEVRVEARTGVYGVTLEVEMKVVARDFDDAEWLSLNAFDSRKPNNKKFVSVTNMTVDSMDETTKPKGKK